MATSKGTVKKTSLEEFAFIPSSGKIALGLDEGDALEWIKVTSGEDDVMLATKQGKSIRFKETDVRPMGRTAHGVRGIKLGKDDHVVDMVTVQKGHDLLLITEGGYGKRTDFEEFTCQNRGGSGLIIARVTKKTGTVLNILCAAPEDELMLMSQQGILIRSRVDSISRIGRATQGVRVMNLDEGDRVASCALVVKSEELVEEEGEEDITGDV
jgi:DNA gyrase subunit A